MSIVDDDVFNFETSDITLLSREKAGVRMRFKVHKRVLKDSPVFNDMFTLGDTAEGCGPANRPEVALPDDASELKNMLQKVYEGQKQYGIDIQRYDDAELDELGRLAVVLDKYQWTGHTHDIKAVIQSQLERQAGELSLPMIVELLPSASQLGCLEIQDMLVTEIGSGMQDFYTSGCCDWRHEPASYKSLEEIDLSFVSRSAFQQMISKLTQNLAASHRHARIAHAASRTVRKFLPLLGHPLVSGHPHDDLACWVGVTLPAWQRAIAKVLPRAWHSGLRVGPEECPFKFGDNGEKIKILKPLVDLQMGDFDGCEECQELIEARSDHLLNAYPSWQAVIAQGTDALPSIAEREGARSHSPLAQTSIRVSRLFNMQDADIHILSRVSAEGHRTRYHLHKNLAMTSPIIQNLLESRSLHEPGDVEPHTVELDEDSEHIDALCSLLYAGHDLGSSGPAVSPLIDKAADCLALGYIVLEKLRFVGCVDKVRGFLRLNLIESPQQWSSRSLLALAQHADQQKDSPLRELVMKCLEKRVDSPAWSGQLLQIAQTVTDLSSSTLRDLVIMLLKAHGKSRIAFETQNKSSLAILYYISPWCKDLPLAHGHKLYACYKLSCEPAWQATRYKLICRFLERLSWLPDQPPDSDEEPVSPRFADFYEDMMQILEKLEIGTGCRICKQAVEDWTKSIGNDQYAHVEKSRKRKRAQNDVGQRSTGTVAAA